MSLVKVNVSQALVGLLGAFIIVWLVRRYFQLRRHHQLSKNVPSAYLELPLVGVAWIFLGSSDAIEKRAMHILNWCSNISKFWLGPHLLYMVNNADYLESILTETNKPKQYEFFANLVGNGLITNSIDLWKRHRRIISPTFSQKNVNEAIEFIPKQCENLAKLLAKDSLHSDEIDVGKYITNCTVDLVCDSIFYYPINAQLRNESFHHTYDTLLNMTFNRILKVWHYPDFSFSLLSKDSKQFGQLRDGLTTLMNQIIGAKRKEYDTRSQDDEGQKKFFDLLINKLDSNEITMEEVQEEVRTMFTAGSDTNATSFTFVLLLLAMHPEVQEELYSEVMDVVGPDRPVCMEDLNNLQFTERVIKEALRIFPTVPFVGRKLTQDITCGKHILPEGSTALISIMAVHRNEKYWKDPLKFDPDRFLPENFAKRPANCYLPFAAGPRMCIGFKFAMIAMKIMAATLVRKVRFVHNDPKAKVEDIEVITNIVLKPKKPIKLKVEIR